MKASEAEFVTEYEFKDWGQVHGVTFDGEHVWFAAGDGDLVQADPKTGRVLSRTAGLGAMAGVAFDGTHLWAICGERIQRIDRKTKEVVSSIPTPDALVSGMAHSDGALWIGVFNQKQILKVDPKDGRVLKTIPVRRFVTGVSWAEGELWHGTLADGANEPGALQCVDVDSGTLKDEIRLPADKGVAGVEYDKVRGLFWCGEHDRDRREPAKIRAVKRRSR